jgi:hypothetical protein
MTGTRSEQTKRDPFGAGSNSAIQDAQRGLGARALCQFQAVRLIVSSSESCGVQPSTAAARAGSATRAGGSPDRRSRSVSDTVHPLTCSIARATSRTE